MSRPRTPIDRLRARMTALAAAGMGVALLTATSIAALRSTQPTGPIPGYTSADGQQVVQMMAPAGGLAPFLVEEDLRPGAVLAAILLIVPFAALALQAPRVGSLTPDRQAAPAGPGRCHPCRPAPAAGHQDRLRLRARRPACRARLPGGAAAARCGPARGLAAASRPADVAATGLAGRGRPSDAGGGSPRGTERHPARRSADSDPSSGPPIAPAGGLAQWTGRTRRPAIRRSRRVDNGLEALLLLVCVRTLVARRAARTGRDRGRADDETSGSPDGSVTNHGTSSRLGPGSSAKSRLVGDRGSHDAAVAVLAAAQRRGNPRASGAVGGVLFVCGLSFGVEAVLVASVVGPSSVGDAAFYVGGALLAAVVGAVGVLVALLALALNLTDHLLSARRSVASTATLGTRAAPPPGRADPRLVGDCGASHRRRDTARWTAVRTTHDQPHAGDNHHHCRVDRGGHAAVRSARRPSVDDHVIPQG